MIQFRSQAYLDFKKYDSCVQRDQNSIPYALSWYLNTVCEQWDCLVLNDYDAVWPLPYRKKLGIKYYFRPFGVQQLGVFSKKPLSDEQLLAFYLEMSRRVLYADVYLNEGQALDAAPIKSLKVDPRLNLKLSINRSYERIYQGFNSNLKRKLKKASKAKMELFEQDGPEVLLKLFRENQGQQLQLEEEFYRVFRALLFQLMHKGMGKVYSVYGGPNQLLAAAFFLEYGSRSIFLFSATSEMGKSENAMAYLINEYLIFQAEKFEYLDFEGSSQEGLARFYRSFGAQDFSYPRLHLNRLPWPLNRLKK